VRPGDIFSVAGAHDFRFLSDDPPAQSGFGFTPLPPDPPHPTTQELVFLRKWEARKDLPTPRLVAMLEDAAENRVLPGGALEELLRRFREPGAPGLSREEGHVLVECAQRYLSKPEPWFSRPLAALALAHCASRGFTDATAAVDTLLLAAFGFPDDEVALAAAIELDPLHAAAGLRARCNESLTIEWHFYARKHARRLTAIADPSLFSGLRESAAAQLVDSDHSLWRRVRAAEILAGLAPADPDAARALGFALSDREITVRQVAAETLAKLGGQLSPSHLERLLTDPRLFVVRDAATTAAGLPALVPSLLLALAAAPKKEETRRALLRRLLEDATGEWRGGDPDAWLRAV
jgi:hypothetical protein